jgi:hypothetical protein
MGTCAIPLEPSPLATQYFQGPSREYCVDELGLKTWPRLQGKPTLQPHIVWVTKHFERSHLFVWPFDVVGRNNRGLFLLTAAGGTEETMLAGEVVVAVGCFAASAAPLHLGFDQDILNPP